MLKFLRRLFEHDTNLADAQAAAVAAEIAKENEEKHRPLHLFSKPDYDLMRQQMRADIAAIKTWKDKAKFYERALIASEVTLFDPETMSTDDIRKYRNLVLLTALDALDVDPDTMVTELNQVKH